MFIQLTDGDGDQVLVNVSEITYVTTLNSRGNNLRKVDYGRNGDYVLVEESFSDIKILLEQACVKR